MTERQQIYLASANLHKVRELQELADAAGLPLALHSAAAVGGMPPVTEDTGTFVGNAAKKAAALLPLLPAGAWALADDSGLCVDHLGGAPGVESAYYAGPAATDAANLAQLVDALRGVPASARGAHYVCVLALHGGPDGELDFRGECHGSLQEVPEGTGGFGYDPLFVPRGHAQSFGLLPPATKRRLSHRAAAWRALAAWWRERFGAG